MSETDPNSELERWLKHKEPQEQPFDFSIIVPAYNEERRLPPALIDIIDYFDRRKCRYEILVVDDGSFDDTSAIVKKIQKMREQVRLLRLPRNHGKGHAVRTGMLNARGHLLLFADADGATPIEEIERLEFALTQGADVAIGSRAIASENTRVSTRWYRKALGRSFNFFVNRCLLPGIADTQCGFKLFTADKARFLFENQQADGFSFDIELLYIARKAGLKVAEVPINWTNISGSKVNLLLDAARMFRDIFLFRIKHADLTPADFARFKENNS